MSAVTDEPQSPHGAAIEPHSTPPVEVGVAEPLRLKGRIIPALGTPTTPNPKKIITASTAARIAVKHLWADLSERSRKLREAADGVPAEWLRNWQRKGKPGARKALDRILTRMPEPPFRVEGRVAIWRVLTPLTHAVQVDAFGCGLNGVQDFEMQPFGLSFTKHSLTRLIDRTGGANLVGAMTAAHDLLLHLTPAEGERIFALPSITLPAADGAFLATPRAVTHRDFPHAECQTWVSKDQLSSKQAAELAAWTTLGASKAPTIVKDGHQSSKQARRKQ